MKFLIIGLTSVFLFSCGKSGELSNTKQEQKMVVDNTAKSMKLSKESNTNAIDKNTTPVYKSQPVAKKPTPMFDTGMRPTNSK